RIAVNMVHLVEVDVIGLQAAQTFLAGAPDVKGRQARLIGPGTHIAVHLRGNDHLIAPTTALRKPAPDDLFGNTFAYFPAINVGAVPEVEAQVQRFIHDRKAVG